MSTGADTLVSVVMIFRDAERFFQESIDSVLAQTHPSLELLLCDDGSTDGSTAIAQATAAAHPHVRYLQHPGHCHLGMSSTRNLGLASARGDLVAFLDADDVWEKEHLEHDVALLSRHPEAGLACGQAVEWHSWNDSGADDVIPGLPWPPGAVVPPPRMLTALLRRGDFRTPTCNLLVRKHVLDAVGGSEPKFRDLYEDQVLLAKLHLAYPCVISGTRTARYRKHAGSSTARALRAGTYSPGLPTASVEAFLRWLASLPQIQVGEEHEELRSLIRDALKSYDHALDRARWRSLALVRAMIPPQRRQLLRVAARRARALGPVRMGSLRHLTPLSRQFGYDRGLPVDRYYIERFLAENAHVISGRVLEVGDSTYTRRFGGQRVTQADVLNITVGDPETTIVADLATGQNIASSSFDCLVITQTLHLVYDLSAAVRTLHRILRPGGTLLATFPGISPISTDRWSETWYWSLTPLSATRLFGDVFGPDNVEVVAYGNVLTSVAFLEGMATRELRHRELETHDPQFPMVVTVRAYRPQTAEPSGSEPPGPP